MRKIASGLLAAVLVLVGAPLLGQRGMGMMPPSISGIWSPVIGAGAVYERVDTKDNTKHLTQVAVISKDTLDGKDGFWLETMSTESDGQQSVSQILMVKDGGQLNFAKIIVQQPGQPPMEISSLMMGMMGGRRGGTPPPTNAAVDARAAGAIIGKETVTTPAGTFDCEHWKSADGTAESWFSPKVSPWAVVKSVTPNSTTTLVRVITDAKSHITGTPVKLEDMMRGRGPGL